MTKSNTPQLRFSEFTDEWQEKKLDDFVIFKKGKNISKNDITKDGKTSCIRYGELYTDYNEVIEKVKSKTNLDIKKLVFSKKNDVIVPSSGETSEDIATSSCVQKDDIALGGDLNILRTKENGVFISYYLSNKKRFDIARLAQGHSVVHLYSNSLKGLKINIPTLPEQKRIADFLTAVNDKIEKIEKKKELFEKYKKGIMQKIFSQQIRFCDENGKSYPDWQEKKLGNILKERNKFAPKDGEFEHISLTTDGVVPKTIRYERDFLVSSKNKKYKITKPNDICYNPANLKFGVIARNKYKQGIFSPIYITFEIKNVNVVYMEYFITRKDFINKARKYEQGTVYERMAVHPSDLINLKIEIPRLDEQQKIADFLTSLDNKIDQINNKLTQAKLFKKSLLQKMFI